MNYSYIRLIVRGSIKRLLYYVMVWLYSDFVPMFGGELTIHIVCDYVYKFSIHRCLLGDQNDK